MRIIRRVVAQELNSAFEITHLDHLISDELYSFSRIELRTRLAKHAIRIAHRNRVGTLHIKLLQELLQQAGPVRRWTENGGVFEGIYFYHEAAKLIQHLAARDFHFQGSPIHHDSALPTVIAEARLGSH